MKKINSIIIIVIITISSFGAGGISNDNSKLNMNLKADPDLIIDVSGGFGVTSVIKNVGDADATNVTFFVGVFGGIPWSRNTIIKHFDIISPEESVKVRFRYIGFGFLKDDPVIQVAVGCEEGEFFESKLDAWIFFNFVILR
ncbi:hypothetical protein AYK24_05450 [Thermoplasmatales archaeon SG8-52-4]|nr:MAG: hypothetical protein AYK24_05450 [Thermoplasmatales archaeon SG8-52-4]